MRKIISILLMITILSTMFIGFNISASAENTTTGFYVDGTTIRDANGNAFVMRGINHAHAWYSYETETAIKGAAERGVNTIRVVISDGQQYYKTSLETIEWIIELCIENKVVPMFEVHDITGKDSTSRLNRTVDYWIEVKDAFIKYEKYAILNIANEWMGKWNNATWSTAYQEAIIKLREAGINNMIVVDAPGWGQDGFTCVKYCKEVFEADVNKNTIFSVHMYGAAGGTKETIKGIIDGVLANNVPIIIGEFGYTHSDGDVEEEYIMEYCTEKEVGYLGWSWKGNSGGVEYLDLAKDWAGTRLSNWGETLFNSDYGITRNSKICSIFVDGEIDDGLLGDVNADGIINIIDVTLTRAQIVNLYELTEDMYKRADVNEDESVDIIDVVRIRSLIVNG